MEIYTDGGWLYNLECIGAWAFVAVADGQVVHKASSGELSTTNNRMEMTAVIEAMKWASSNNTSRTVSIITDSDLTVKCGNGLWKRRANLDLWKLFDAARQSLAESVPDNRLSWVRGHAGNTWNEMADRMCSEEMRNMVSKLRVRREGWAQ